MSSTGRYYVKDPASGRLFCVEPISERDQKVSDKSVEMGGVEQARGGSVTEVDSVIKPENGFVNIITLGPGVSPDSHISELLKQPRPAK
jgi:hypothetical protein